jgi:ABC-type uncharacterized transport system auxiliary subunit
MLDSHRGLRHAQVKRTREPTMLLRPARLRSLASMTMIALLMAACAWQSEAMKIGPDLYQTSANASPARGAATGAREMALTNANKKCESLGKQIEVVDTKSEYAFPANAVVTVTFRCK